MSSGFLITKYAIINKNIFYNLFDTSNLKISTRSIKIKDFYNFRKNFTNNEPPLPFITLVNRNGEKINDMVPLCYTNSIDWILEKCTFMIDDLELDELFKEFRKDLNDLKILNYDEPIHVNDLLPNFTKIGSLIKYKQWIKRNFLTNVEMTNILIPNSIKYTFISFDKLEWSIGEDLYIARRLHRKLFTYIINEMTPFIYTCNVNGGIDNTKYEIAKSFYNLTPHTTSIFLREIKSNEIVKTSTPFKLMSIDSEKNQLKIMIQKKKIITIKNTKTGIQ